MADEGRRTTGPPWGRRSSPVERLPPTHPDCSDVRVTANVSRNSRADSRPAAQEEVKDPNAGSRHGSCERMRMATSSPVDKTPRLSSLRAGVTTDAASQATFHGLIGRGPAMQDVFAAMRRFAPHARIALVAGEVGTGKAMVARTLHHLGPRRGGPFVEVRCTAGMDGAQLRTLFGSAGAPDACEDDRGTVFIDDVDELPWPLQSTLLELLEAGEAPRCQRSPSGPHVIAATIRDLRTEVALGRFRADLFYRLTAFELRLPLLSARLDDLPKLAARFTHEAGLRLERPSMDVSAGAVRLLQSVPWPGNLRELRNVLERACILSDDSTLSESDIRAALRQAPPIAERGPLAAPAASRLDDKTRAELRMVLDQSRGNKSAAARHLGVSRRSFYRLLERLHA